MEGGLLKVFTDSIPVSILAQRFPLWIFRKMSLTIIFVLIFLAASNSASEVTGEFSGAASIFPFFPSNIPKTFRKRIENIYHRPPLLLHY